MPHIELTLNHARQELLRDGWGVIKSAKAFIPAEFVAIADEGHPEYPGFYAEGALPDAAWFEPVQGLLTLKPNFLRDDWLWDASVNTNTFLQSTDYTFANADEWEEYKGLEADGQTHNLHFQASRRDLADTDGVLTALGSLSPDITALQALTSGDVSPVFRTSNPLGVNEGIGIILWNFGYAGERDELYRWGVFFGGRWFLRQHLNGKWTLYQNWGTQADPLWAIAEEFHVAQGMVASDRPVHVGIIPIQPRHLAFYISDVQAPTDRSTRYAGTAGPAFIHEVQGQGDGDPDITLVGNVWMFCQRGEVVEGSLKRGISYSIAMHKVRYPDSVTVALMPENLPRPIPEVAATAASNMWVYGHDISGTIVKAFTNHRNQAWTAASDRFVVPKITLSPFDSNRRAPYVIGYEFRWPSVTYTPVTTPIALDGNWVSIDFTLSEDPGGNSLSARLTRFAEFEHLLKLDATLRLTVDGEAVWDGYVEDLTNTIVGSTGKTITSPTGVPDDPETEPDESTENIPEHQVMMLTTIEGYDMWDRLERTKLPRYVGVHGLSAYRDRNVYERVADVIERAGMVPNDAGSGLANLDLPYWQMIDEMPAIVEDSSAADEIREVVDAYGAQFRGPVRCIWNGTTEEVDVTLGETYAVDPNDPTEEELPTLIIVLDATIIEEIEGSQLTDAQRWDDLADRQYLHALSDPEFTVRRGEYNALSMFSATSGDQHARGFAVHIDPDPASLGDEDHIDFQAGVRTLALTPAEAGQGPSTGELARMARHKYAEFCTTERMLSLRAEWQPFVKPPMFAAILGRNPAGEIVSFGAWRIAHAHVELMADIDESPTTGFGTHPDRRYLWNAEYTLFYEGVADYVIGEVTIPMFSEVIP